jgi:hypothetical protein
LTLDQAQALLPAAEGAPLEAYVVLSLLTGARTEELRGLTWQMLEIENVPPMHLLRSVRREGAIKTPRSRRTLELPEL